MVRMYGKIHQSLYTGSLIGAGPDVFSVWGWVIAHVVDGIVEINPTLLAMVIGKITPDEVCEVIKFLGLPDKNSRTRDEDGRRLIPISEDAEIMPGRAVAYRVVNHALYREFRTPMERREYMRDYMRRRRKNESDVNSSKPCKPLAVNVRQAEAEAEADTEAESKTKKNKIHAGEPAGDGAGVISAEYPSGMIQFWNIVPKMGRERSSRKKVFIEWKKQKLEPIAFAVIAVLGEWKKCETWTKDGGQYVRAIHDWLKDEQWREVPERAKPAFDPDETDHTASMTDEVLRRLYPDDADFERAKISVRGPNGNGEHH
jgi:hypothetical protein